MSHSSGQAQKPSVFGRVVAAVIFTGAYFAYPMIAERFSRDDDVFGQRCGPDKKCPGTATCMLVIDEQRQLGEGYCTYPCNWASGCPTSMACQQGMALTDNQGKKWDGMIGKSRKVCVQTSGKPNAVTHHR